MSLAGEIAGRRFFGHLLIEARETALSRLMQRLQFRCRAFQVPFLFPFSFGVGPI